MTEPNSGAPRPHEAPSGGAGARHSPVGGPGPLPLPLDERPDARDEIIQRRMLLIQLQSDLAYFQARLGLIGEPVTTNQEAQRRTFKLLHQALGQKMIKARKGGA